VIWIRADSPGNVLCARADGTVRGDDYRGILRPALEKHAAEHGRVRMVYELGGAFRRMTLSALREDCRLGAWLFSRLGRLAVVSDRFWVRAFATAFRIARPGRVRVFPEARYERAVAWARESGSPEP